MVNKSLNVVGVTNELAAWALQWNDKDGQERQSQTVCCRVRSTRKVFPYLYADVAVRGY